MKSTTQTVDYKKIAIVLEEKYVRYNHPEFIAPDPLMVIRIYKNLREREFAAFIAAHFALGRACCISDTVKTILSSICFTAQQKTKNNFSFKPLSALLALNESDLMHSFKHFVYRFFSVSDLVSLLMALQSLYLSYSSLEALLAQCLNSSGGSVVAALTQFVRTLETANPLKYNWKSNLVPSPKNGSACKRLLLFLRWMVRTDAVDPGGWSVLKPAELLAPLDTHAIRSYRQLGFINTSAVSMKTVLTVTKHLRHIAPDDPLKYDFVLSRPYASCE